MTKDKIVAQGSHASLGVIFGMMDKEFDVGGENYTMTLNIKKDSPLKEWLDTIFTKVCVYVNSEEELLELYEKANEFGLPCCLITDRGLTQFNGNPTKTALAIGPCYSEEVDQITGHLKLL